MSYQLLESHGIPARDAELDYDDLGAGLYVEEGVPESVYELDDGSKVAVSVRSKWLANGGGVVFTAWARWIEDDGQTRLCPFGEHIETVLSYNADAAIVDLRGIPALAKELALAVIGEPPTLVDVPAEEGGTIQLPMVGFGDEVRLNVSIRNAITNAGATGMLDASNLL